MAITINPESIFYIENPLNLKDSSFKLDGVFIIFNFKYIRKTGDEFRLYTDEEVVDTWVYFQIIKTVAVVISGNKGNDYYEILSSNPERINIASLGDRFLVWYQYPKEIS